jgi:hypothetical protein
MHVIICDSSRTLILNEQYLKRTPNNIYLSNLDTLSNSDSLDTISCYPKIPKMCSCFKICYPKCSLGVRFLEYLGSGSAFMPGATFGHLVSTSWSIVNTVVYSTLFTCRVQYQFMLHFHLLSIIGR